MDIDVLIATDCISEGQNLQDCDYLINYDIHWNPVRIIQRFGRIDRIGSSLVVPRSYQVALLILWILVHTQQPFYEEQPSVFQAVFREVLFE